MGEPVELLKMAIEVAVFAVLIYLVLRFLRETRGSGVVRGLALILVTGISVFVVLIQTLDLSRLAQLFDTIAQSVVIGLIVVFHPEIRRAIVKLGDSPIFGRFFRGESKVVHRLLLTIARLSRQRIGALISIEREASLTPFADTGIKVDADVNSYLMESIFFPKSVMHDGAVIVRKDRIVSASCLLPLSQNAELDKRLGTRHRAALGLAEETDAVSIIVSEETGNVSLAHGGKLYAALSMEEVERQLNQLLRKS